MSALEILAPGPFATVQDLGRPGHSRWGVGTSGAADRSSLRLANRILANAEAAAAIEVTLGGLAVRARGPAEVALTGAPCPASCATAGGTRAVGHAGIVDLLDGDVLRLGAPAAGVRTYVAVRGGIDVPAVLGSRATDVLAGLGPAPLAAGTVLPVGPPPRRFPQLAQVPVPPPPTGDVVLRVVLGPRDDWFPAAALDELCRAAWTVTSDSDRVGMRLDGPRLPRVDDRELPSEGMVRGALQVPPSGRPTLLLADHPVTGGYPVIAVVRDADVDRAAQAVPGQVLRLRAVASPLGRGDAG